MGLTKSTVGVSYILHKPKPGHLLSYLIIISLRRSLALRLRPPKVPKTVAIAKRQNMAQLKVGVTRM